MIVNKRTRNKTDIINFKDKTKITLEFDENTVDEKYRED